MMARRGTTSARGEKGVVNFSSAEMDLFNLALTVKRHRRLLVMKLVDEHDGELMLTFAKAADMLDLDQRRLEMVFDRASQMSKDIRHGGSLGRTFTALAPSRRIAFLRGVVALQKFSDETLGKERDCRVMNLGRLDIALLVLARNNFKSMCERTGKSFGDYYALPVISKALSDPRKIVDAAYPTYIISGLWLAQARVLSGLADDITETPNTVTGEAWEDQGIASQVEQCIRLDDEAEERLRPFERRLEELLRRPGPSDRMRLRR